MAGRVIGYVALPVVPSFAGFGSKLASGISAPIATAATAGGKSAGSGIVEGIVNGAKTAVATAGKVLAVGFTTVAAAGATVAAIAFKGGFARALNIQDAVAQLTGLGHSTETVTAIMGNALAAVKGTAFGLDAAATLAATVVAAGIKPGAELERTLRLTADAATIAKTPLGEMGDIIGKVASSQKLTTEVVNQFSQRGVPLLQMVADQYGITAEAASEMVSKGEVDFATFQNALEAGVGGSALASGATARGAFANIGAALSRFGALFATPLVAAAPTFFASVSGAIDRVTVVAAPFAAIFAEKVTAGLSSAAAWIDKIDFQKLVDGIRGVYDLVTTGKLTEGLTGAFGWTPNTGIVVFLQGARQMILDIVTAIKGGDVSSLGGTFSTLGSVVAPLVPVFLAVGKGIGAMGGTIAELFAAGLPLLVPILEAFTSVLKWLGDNSGAVAPIIFAIAAAVLAYRAAQILGNAAAVAALPLTVSRTAALFAQAYATDRLATATFLANGVEKEGLIAKLPATAAVIAQTAANVGARVAALGAAAATGVVTAAQWLWNAALSANPIGIILVLVAGLVAGIIWVATQTTFFQDTWAAATSAIGAAAGWLWNSAIKPALDGIGAGFQWLWDVAIKPALDAVVAGFSWLWTFGIKPVFDAIGAIFNWIYGNIIVPIIIGIAIYIAIWAAIITWLWETVIQPVFNLIGALFNWIYQTVIVPIINAIVAYVKMWGSIFTWIYQSIVMPVFNAIGAAFNWIYQSIIMPIINAIVAYVRLWGSIFTWIYQSIIMPVFNAIGAAFNWIYQTVILGVVNGIISTIQALGAVFPWLWNNAINPALQAVGAAFRWIFDSVIRPVGDAISNAVRAIGGVFSSVFSGIASFVGTAFAGIAGAVRGPINAVIGLANGAIGALNKISVKIPDWVPQVGGQTFGLSIPRIPTLASGANIAARAGGTLALLGEGGRAETVTDLGLTNRLIAATLALVTKAPAGGSGGDQILQVENLGYNPDEIFSTWDTKKKQASILEGLSEEVGAA